MAYSSSTVEHNISDRVPQRYAQITPDRMRRKVRRNEEICQHEAENAFRREVPVALEAGELHRRELRRNREKYQEDPWRPEVPVTQAELRRRELQRNEESNQEQAKAFGREVPVILCELRRRELMFRAMVANRYGVDLQQARKPRRDRRSDGSVDAQRSLIGVADRNDKFYAYTVYGCGCGQRLRTRDAAAAGGRRESQRCPGHVGNNAQQERVDIRNGAHAENIRRPQRPHFGIRGPVVERVGIRDERQVENTAPQERVNVRGDGHVKNTAPHERVDLHNGAYL